ncbi:MAG: chemotaxis protein CheB [Cyanobacteriota bacterium]|nr:chemotaxis protein CheB [Cyanobacteriota bacterium]
MQSLHRLPPPPPAFRALPGMTSPLTRVVAIGASAGGLKALQELLGQVKPGIEAAFVVAQHLAPDHASQIVPLLTRATQLRVESAADGQALERGCVVVAPPNCDVTIESGHIKLTPPAPRFGPSPSVDRLFDSLANACGEHGVAILLSGTGSDGACGLRAVGASGGITVVQSPESALFDGMPSAAIALGSPDLIATPQAIGARLTEWLSGGGHWHEVAASSQPLLLTSAAHQLKESTGIDFSEYKESTLRRQIYRRMAVTGIKTMEAYLQLLASDVTESRALMQNLLVAVTAFFRNPDAFEELKRHLCSQAAELFSSPPFRVWVPGCATGEEAYSLGMIISETLGHPQQLSDVLKIFATDLDEQSLTIARKATYPISAANTIPLELRERFTIDKGTQFEMSKDLRSCIIFARHNICEDPPFPDIDLVSCRNLLIYFTAALQERVIDLLSFSLRPGGLLFLGGAESLGEMSGFRLLNPLFRLYERTQEVRTRYRLASMLVQRKTPQERLPVVVSNESESLPTQHIQLLDALIRIFAKPCLVVDANHLLVEVIGDVSPFCQMPQGRLTSTAISFLRDDLKAEARALLLLARAGRTPVRSGRLILPELPSPLRLEAAPILVGQQNLTILSFIQEMEAESPMPVFENVEHNTIFAQEIERLEQELLTSQDTLRRSLLHLERVNEELEASSEELQASSEELQSSNEELEASNEELQASNDEMAALNQQLRVRGDELERLNTDLENIQRSVNQGMVILDQDLRVVRFSPLAVRVFGLVAADIGQSLIGIPTTVPVQGLRETLLSVVHEARRCSLQATSEDNAYLLQLMPYRNSERQILGAIITMTDVSELVALRHVAEASLQEFERLTDALDQAVWKRDWTTKQILYISARIAAITGWTASDIAALPDLLDTAIVPSDRAAVLAAREAAGQAGWDLTYQISHRDGRIRRIHEVAITLQDLDSDHAVVGTMADITEQQAILQHTHVLTQACRMLLDNDPRPAALLDSSLVFICVNERLAQHLQMRAEQLIGQSMDVLAEHLSLRDPATPPSAPTPLSQTFREVAQQVIDTNQSCLAQPCVLLQPEPQTLALNLDFLPIAHPPDPTGLLLLLNSESPPA